MNEKYETQLTTWLPEHPFLAGRKFRNAVFEAVALAVMLSLGDQESNNLVTRYMGSHKHSYHLVYMADALEKDFRVDTSHLNILLTAAMEFRSVHSNVELRVDGEDWRECPKEGTSITDVGIDIEILLGTHQEPSKTFSFYTSVPSDEILRLGPRLAGAFISVPCSVELSGSQEIELTAPVEIDARNIKINASSLVLKQSFLQSDIMFSSQTLEDGPVDTIITNGVPLVFSVEETSGISYPVIKYIKQAEKQISDPLLHQKYVRLKRILMEFRSHSKGSLAKYKEKIEHDRILKNDIGRNILSNLLKDNILRLDGKFYHVNPDGLHEHLGTTWQALREGHVTDTMLNYLKDI